MHRALILLLLAGCTRLGRPAITYGVAEPLPLVHATTDDRWYVVVEDWLDEPVLFFLDTGYSYSTCDDGLIEALDLETRGRVRIRGEAGTLAIPMTQLPPLPLGGHALDTLTCVVRDLHTTSSIHDPPDVRIGGVLGSDLLRRFRVVVDPVEAVVALQDPAEVEPLPRRDPEVVRLRREYRIGLRATVALRVDGRRYRPVLDTGASGTYLDADRLGEPERVVKGAVVRGSGEAGQVVRDLRLYRAEEVELAGSVVEDVLIVHRERAPWVPGLLGLNVLGGFRQEYDYAHRRARFTPIDAEEVPTWRTWVGRQQAEEEVSPPGGAERSSPRPRPETGSPRSRPDGPTPAR